MRGGDFTFAFFKMYLPQVKILQSFHIMIKLNDRLRAKTMAYCSGPRLGTTGSRRSGRYREGMGKRAAVRSPPYHRGNSGGGAASTYCADTGAGASQRTPAICNIPSRSNTSPMTQTRLECLASTRTCIFHATAANKHFPFSQKETIISPSHIDNARAVQSETIK